MASVLLRDGRLIENFAKPYVVAEVNSSHNGCVETAKEMIKKAKEAGCSCVKFQSWSASSLYSASYYKDNPVAKRIVEKFALSEEELAEVVECCKTEGISFSSTPYAKKEVDFLVERCNVPFIKIASMEINNYEFLSYIAKKNIPVVLSTGMAELDEIKRAVKVIEDSGNRQIILLHCISIYPAAPDTIHLNNIAGLQKEFPTCPIGFSDHTLGTEISSAAVALGACIIEKHFTLDNKKMGMDNNMAIEPEEMKKLVKNASNVFEAMGSTERVVSEAEYKQRKNMRRSIIVVRDMKKGDIIGKEDLSLKRPGTGLVPEKLSAVIGKKLVHDLEADTMIQENDFE